MTSPRQSTSVVIPVRNGAQFIEEAIASALPQLASDDEVLVVDDASTDGSRGIVGAIADRRIQILNGPGRGVSSARNIGMAAARGQFIAFLDCDDLWPATRHQTLLEAFVKNPEVDCVIGRIRLQIEEGAILIPALENMDGRLEPMLSMNTALYRRRILDRVGLFDETLNFSEDTDYLLRLQECNYRYLLCDTDALIYRRHEHNATCDTPGRQQALLQLIRRKRERVSRPALSRR
jgi:glycosyltransferase involved in cell wall biosynthesis